MDISEWKIQELHRKGNDASVWYFKIAKPDGKRLVVDETEDYYGLIWSSRMPGSGVWSEQSRAATELYVKSATEAGAIRKIMRYVEYLARDWNLREAIRAEAPKQVTFNGKRPTITDAGHLLEARKPEPVEEEGPRKRRYF